MREHDLRNVLLVKAVEETDTDGTLLPPADRLAAAREAMRAAPGEEEAMMAVRARILLERIAARHPFVAGLLALLGENWRLTLVLAALGAVVGGLLPVLDGSQRVNVLAFPLLGLVAWNFGVYAVLLVAALRRSGGPSPMRSAAAALGTRFATSRIAASRAFNAPLAAALQAFAQEWRVAATPLLLSRAARAFHLAAAAVAAGLIAGLYLRGIAFSYQAGWESTFLDATQARTLLTVLYGPASLLTGIPIPGAAELEAIRWRATGGGENAARWIHLMAATALLYVIVPRLLLAAWAGTRAALLARRTPVPDSLARYFRDSFAQVEGALRPVRAVIIPYACELGPRALARLIAWVRSTLGGSPEVDAQASVPYGEEERHLAALRSGTDDAANVIVLPFNLASTPEDENHGAVLAGARDWAAARMNTRLFVVIDEAPYAARMADTPGRMDERRAAWRTFVESRGLEPHFVSLQ